MPKTNLHKIKIAWSNMARTKKSKSDTQRSNATQDEKHFTDLSIA